MEMSVTRHQYSHILHLLSVSKVLLVLSRCTSCLEPVGLQTQMGVFDIRILDFIFRIIYLSNLLQSRLKQASREFCENSDRIFYRVLFSCSDGELRPPAHTDCQSWIPSQRVPHSHDHSVTLSYILINSVSQSHIHPQTVPSIYLPYPLSKWQTCHFDTIIQPAITVRALGDNFWSSVRLLC